MEVSQRSESCMPAVRELTALARVEHIGALEFKGAMGRWRGARFADCCLQDIAA